MEILDYEEKLESVAYHQMKELDDIEEVFQKEV